MRMPLPQQLRVANVRAAGAMQLRVAHVRATGAMQLRVATELRVASLRAECGRRRIIFCVAACGRGVVWPPRCEHTAVKNSSPVHASMLPVVVANTLVLANGYGRLAQLDIRFRVNYTDSVVGFAYEGGP